MTDRRSNSEFTLLVLPMLMAVLMVRTLLALAPGVGGSEVIGVHVHHLLSGVLLSAMGGIAAILGGSRGGGSRGGGSRRRLRSAAIAIFGFGLGLALDEWVLFVLRERHPETPYTAPGSLIGSLLLVGAASLYAFAVYSRRGPETLPPRDRAPRL